MKISLISSVLAFLFTLISANDVTMTITPSSTNVQATNNYAIFINRTKSITGATITPTSIGNPILIKFVFDESYSISSA